MKIYLRDLVEKDALTSYKWRNNPNIWKFTGRKPDKVITPEIELEWIKEVLQRPHEKRYAICINGTDEYIGNVQLTNIDKGEAEFHIFIGEEKYWGKGIGTQATLELIKIAFNQLKLKKIYLFVNKKNIPAIKAYLNCGFIIESCTADQIKMEIKNE